ncbi:MAG: hypothetical protein V4615_03365 [Bacteroidota bacterium]
MIFSKLSGLIRLGNWWHYKIPPLIAIFFFSEEIFGEHTIGEIWYKLLLLICWMFSAASFGYFINDWSDVAEDGLAGKKNLVARLSVPLRWLFAFCMPALAILIQVLINGFYSTAFLLSVGHLVFFILYSVPPFRLKHYLLPAIFCDSLYAHVLPSAIVFTSICNTKDCLPLLFLLCASQFTGGVRNILLHHLFDRKNDLVSGNSNFANKFHSLFILKIVNRLLLPLDLLLVLIFFSFVSIYLVYIFSALVLFRLFLVHVCWRIKRLWLNKKMSYWLLNDVYEGYIPFISILLFSLSSLKIFIVLCVVYPFVFPHFVTGLVNDMRHINYYLKSISCR